MSALRFSSPPKTPAKPCPVCGGSGENLLAHCSNCDGWGFVPEDLRHVHDFQIEYTNGRGFDILRCTVCGLRQDRDSSD